MREDADTRHAKSLHKEYLSLVKCATREGASEVEKAYYSKMANSTYNKIDQRALHAKKKKVERRERDEEYDR